MGIAALIIGFALIAGASLCLDDAADFLLAVYLCATGGLICPVGWRLVLSNDRWRLYRRGLCPGESAAS